MTMRDGDDLMHSLEARIRERADYVDFLVTFTRWAARDAWADNDYAAYKQWCDRANGLYRAWLRLCLAATDARERGR
jgi:hypothetical protein